MGRGSLKASVEGIKKAKKALSYHGLTQKALGEELGISRATISNFFNHRNVDRWVFNEICHKLNLNWQEIFEKPEVNYSNDWVVSLNNAGENPFQTAGTLPCNAPSYIQRECDRKIEKYIKNENLISIIGDYEIGKSSLLMQVCQMQPNDSQTWKNCFIDFTDMRTDNSRLFINKFFARLGFDEMESWDVLATDFNQQPMLLCIDEFGALEPEIAKFFIPKIFKLTTSAKANIRIVVCLREKIDDFFRRIQIHHPKYIRNWKCIVVESFKKEEALQLFGLLPEPVAEITFQHYQSIVNFSSLQPRLLQSLCYSLFEAAKQGQTQIELIDIIQNPDSYQ